MIQMYKKTHTPKILLTGVVMTAFMNTGCQNTATLQSIYPVETVYKETITANPQVVPVQAKQFASQTPIKQFVPKNTQKAPVVTSQPFATPTITTELPNTDAVFTNVTQEQLDQKVNQSGILPAQNEAIANIQNLINDQTDETETTKADLLLPKTISTVKPDAMQRTKSPQNINVSKRNLPLFSQLMKTSVKQMKNGQMQQAKQNLQRAQRLFPSSPGVYYFLASIELENGNPQGAKTLAQKGLGYDSNKTYRKRLWTLILKAATQLNDERSIEQANKQLRWL